MIATRLVVPSGLAGELVKRTTRGTLRGRYISEERLMVAISGSIESEEKPIYCDASARIFSHWAFHGGDGKSESLPWVQVKLGFSEAWRDRLIKKPADLHDWIEDAAFLPETTDAYSLCLLEPFQDTYFPFLVICGSGSSEWVFRGEVELIPAVPQLPTAMDALAPLQTLKSKSVAVVGLGSGGSAIAVALAAAGVGTLHLFDHDHLSVDNLHRHVCDLRHIGRAKVRALRDIIADYNLPTKVIGHEVDVVQDAKQLWVAASEVDLLVGATDNTASRRFVNYVAIHTGTLLVMGCAFDNARIGEIIQVVPEVSACYECTRKYLIGSGALVAGNHIGESDRISYGGDEPLAEGESNTGTRVEVSLIANLQAKICIHILMYPMTASDAGSVGDAKQNGLARNATQLPANYLTWGVSADTENNSRGEPFAFDLPFCVNWLPIPRHEECPVCGLIGRDNEDDLGQRYADIMASVQPSEA